jgi:glycosyltransferase involved in cell wall biosynthesis
MSIKIGNEFYKNGMYEKALYEYKKVDTSSLLFKQADFNCKMTAARIERTNNQLKVRESRSAALNNILLSIIMPVYNVAPYLDASIISVLSQTYKNFELIIINDASSDNSKDIINMYAQLDRRIKVIDIEHNTLGGAGIPSNIGIKMAKGQYIGFVDSDDWIPKNAFDNLIRSARIHNAEIVIGNFKTFDENGRAIVDAYDYKVWDSLPLNRAFAAFDFPVIFRLSPVPWRKLYKREFLEKYNIRYPEGDFFYEDNPLHWFVLSKADRIVVNDSIVSYHRMAREGQTMNSSVYKLSAMCSHINTIGNFLIKNGIKNKSLILDEFYDFCYRSEWVADRQNRPEIKALIKKQIYNMYSKQSRRQPPLNTRQNFNKKFNDFKLAYPDMDLTIVIPSYNCEDFIEETILSAFQIKNLKFNVLVMDDGSKDGTFELCNKLACQFDNIFVFQQSNKGAGRARNALIPLCVGRYTYFLDADDTIDGKSLEKSIVEATEFDNDLFFFKYRINYFDNGTTRDMFDSDNKIWANYRDAMENSERKNIASRLINYPWNRIIKTELLHDSNIFFGPTIVHNDIPFHWHSIVSASNIGFGDYYVCTHRKFKIRDQITNIHDHRRMMVFESLRFTQEKVFNLPSCEHIKGPWTSFSKHLIEWARERTPDEFTEHYEAKRKEFLQNLRLISDNQMVEAACMTF